MPKLGQFLEIKEAPEYLGVCMNTLRNWEATGKIPMHRHSLNNYRLFRISDLDALIPGLSGRPPRQNERPGETRQPPNVGLHDHEQTRYPSRHHRPDPARLGWKPVVMVEHYQVSAETILTAEGAEGRRG